MFSRIRRAIRRLWVFSISPTVVSTAITAEKRLHQCPPFISQVARLTVVATSVLKDGDADGGAVAVATATFCLILFIFYFFYFFLF